ncbi:ABC-2 type transporter [Clostridium collagenovorans DSM 3089]|uniref:ABC-2 type transporter n=1 Tax=Clostridium collagenovorans DSM 3089 TaxID=1121306 RepID=A0A1M5X560_9CLOT|nr:ABC transporter permease [Clostridium collagenovorans]SHH94975.1 ABC-2 type transporter [Clostridium collagenovorans DSM 3089]
MAVGKVTGIKFLIDSWIMAALVSIVEFTSTLGAFGTMVNDRERENAYDFMVSPISNLSIVLGYVISAAIIGLIMSTLATIFSQLFIYFNGGSLLDITSMFKVLAVVFISVLMATAINMFIVSSIKYGCFHFCKQCGWYFNRIFNRGICSNRVTTILSSRCNYDISTKSFRLSSEKNSYGEATK